MKKGYDIKDGRRDWWNVVAFIGIMLGFILWATVSFAQSVGNTSPDVFPTDSKPFGKSYRHMSKY